MWLFTEVICSIDKSRMTGDCHVWFCERLREYVPSAYSTLKPYSIIADIDVCFEIR